MWVASTTAHIYSRKVSANTLVEICSTKDRNGYRRIVETFLFGDDYDDNLFKSGPGNPPEPQPVYYADGSGYLPGSGPAGPLYFDKFGNT